MLSSLIQMNEKILTSRVADDMFHIEEVEKQDAKSINPILLQRDQFLNNRVYLERLIRR